MAAGLRSQPLLSLLLRSTWLLHGCYMVATWMLHIFYRAVFLAACMAICVAIFMSVTFVAATWLLPQASFFLSDTAEPDGPQFWAVPGSHLNNTLPNTEAGAYQRVV